MLSTQRNTYEQYSTVYLGSGAYLFLASVQLGTEGCQGAELNCKITLYFVPETWACKEVTLKHRLEVP